MRNAFVCYRLLASNILNASPGINALFEAFGSEHVKIVQNVRNKFIKKLIIFKKQKLLHTLILSMLLALLRQTHALDTRSADLHISFVNRFKASFYHHRLTIFFPENQNISLSLGSRMLADHQYHLVCVFFVVVWNLETFKTANFHAFSMHTKRSSFHS